MLKTRYLVVVVLLLMFSSSNLYAKPAPPGEFAQILGGLSEVEEGFENDNWSGARASLEEVVALFTKVNSSYAEVVPANLLGSFFASAKGLDQFLEQQEEEKAEDGFINLQVVLFEIMGYFDYKIHPVIGVLKKYIGDEARGALKEDNLAEVYSELKEVMTFVTKNASLLQQKGVKHENIQIFMKSLGEAMQQVRANDKAAIKASLKDLESQVDEFQKSFI